jgi:hypothetical protein
MDDLVALSPSRTSFSISTISTVTGVAGSEAPQMVSTEGADNYHEQYVDEHPFSFRSTMLAPEPTMLFRVTCIECSPLVSNLTKAVGQPQKADAEAEILQHYYCHSMVPEMHPDFRKIANLIIEVNNAHTQAVFERKLGIIPNTDVDMVDTDMSQENDDVTVAEQEHTDLSSGLSSHISYEDDHNPVAEQEHTDLSSELSSHISYEDDYDPEAEHKTTVPGSELTPKDSASQQHVSGHEHSNPDQGCRGPAGGQTGAAVSYNNILELPPPHVPKGWGWIDRFKEKKGPRAAEHAKPFEQLRNQEEKMYDEDREAEALMARVEKWLESI